MKQDTTLCSSTACHWNTPECSCCQGMATSRSRRSHPQHHRPACVPSRGQKGSTSQRLHNHDDSDQLETHRSSASSWLYSTFPVMRQPSYLDNTAITPTASPALRGKHTELICIVITTTAEHTRTVISTLMRMQTQQSHLQVMSHRDANSGWCDCECQ